MPTIIISLIIAALVVVITVNEIKKRRSGKCSCGCSQCQFKNSCNNK